MPQQIRIGLAGTTTTTFSTSTIAVLALDKSASGEELSNRSEFGEPQIIGRSIYGTSAIAGPQHKILYQWEFNSILSDSDALVLGALLHWQKANPTTGLRLIDEVQYLDPVASQPRTLLATLNPTWNGAYVYGYGVFTVLLSVEPGWRSRFARPSEGWIKVTFGAEEL